ncbi:hypothetical protein GCM10010447_33390 [Streptomyces fulvorobeus]
MLHSTLPTKSRAIRGAVGPLGTVRRSRSPRGGMCGVVGGRAVTEVCQGYGGHVTVSLRDLVSYTPRVVRVRGIDHLRLNCVAGGCTSDLTARVAVLHIP